ncbi:alpha/beta hydrolase [Cysteiniphilum sp. QT6929]|uniref:alpha/beta hydrolase n=1 Tax=Cysteiniphilum sp. QT6929 TaxID=2975055 RepID=UPI0024B35BF4|nr:alpha/beta hydrolase [Cysteiniphilum sp. QT6929]WHN66302.1 alpha/beta hydrolase [Cysteiniphilum sp. QT6929]
MLKHTTSLASGLLLSCFTLTSLSASNSFNSSDSPIHWQACSNHQNSKDYLCATLKLPLEYNQPELGNIDIYLTLYNPYHAQKVLLYNPGGPWLPVSELDLQPLFSQRLLKDYAILGFDPRGFGQSTRLNCHINERIYDQFAKVEALPQAITGLIELRNQIYLSCQKHDNKLFTRMGTEYTLQDLEKIRQQLNLGKINFLAQSYGTYLAEYYLAKYPQHVNKLVLDGVMGADRNLYEANKTLAIADKESFDYAFDLCAKDTHCPIYPNPWIRFYQALTRVKYGEVYAHKRQVLESDFLYRLMDFVNNEKDYDKIYLLIDKIMQKQNIDDLFDFSRNDQLAIQAAYSAVICQDSYHLNFNSFLVFLNQPTFDAITKHMAIDFSLPCTGLWQNLMKASTKLSFTDDTPQILMLANHYDPQTPYVDAKAMHELIPHSTLVSYHGGGHCSYRLTQDKSIDQNVDDYLLK